MILEFTGDTGKFCPRIRSTGCLASNPWTGSARPLLPVLATSETRSVGQVPAFTL